MLAVDNRIYLHYHSIIDLYLNSIIYLYSYGRIYL